MPQQATLVAATGPVGGAQVAIRLSGPGMAAVAWRLGLYRCLRRGRWRSVLWRQAAASGSATTTAANASQAAAVAVPMVLLAYPAAQSPSGEDLLEIVGAWQ